MTKLLPFADTLSSSCCAQSEVILSLLGGRRRAVDRALFRKLNERVYGLNSLGGFTSSGYFDVNVAASLGRAFACRRILQSLNLLKRPEALEVGEGALSKFFAGKVYDYLGFSSVSSAATGALAPFRKSHVSLPTSAVNAPSLAHIRGDVALSYLNGLAQRMLLSTKRPSRTRHS